MFLVTGIYVVLKIDEKFFKKEYPKFYISLLKYDRIELQKSFVKKLNPLLKDKSKESLDLIQTQIAKNADNEKVPFIVVVSGFSILFIPLWSNYIDSIMDVFKNDFKQLTKMFFMFSILITALAYFKFIMSSFINVFFTNFYKWQDLNKLITEYRIKRNDK